jgi:hypothetical protein
LIYNRFVACREALPGGVNVDHRRRPIIVFGMDRSGTSTVANLVARWGAYGGDPRDLEDGNEFNLRGFFEHDGLRELVDDLLASTDIGYWDARFHAMLVERAADPDCRRRAVELIDRMAASGRPWFWKEPNLSVLMPFWQPFLGDCVYVIPVRDPYDSAVSFERFFLSPSLRKMITIRGAMLLRWQHFLRSCLEITESQRDKIFIPYEEMTQDPETHCRRLAGFLDACYGTDGLPPDRVTRMTEAIDPQLRRCRGATPFDEREDVTAEQKALYRFLRTKVDDASYPYQPERYPMNAGWREYLRTVTILCNAHMETESALRSPLVQGAYYAHKGVRWLAARPFHWLLALQRRRQRAAGH